MTPQEARAALTLVTGKAVEAAQAALRSTQSVDDLLVIVPSVIEYFSDGAAALAADYYDDLREEAAVTSRFVARPVVNLREERIRRGTLWAAEPLRTDDLAVAAGRLADVVQLESARPFRDTILANSDRDPAAVGWRRHASASACRMCRMLAARGAVYRQSTATFATHPTCNCTASPVFDGDSGPEASVLQYVASHRRKSPGQKEALRAYLAAMP